jgi:hypothetical protein
MLAMAVAGAPLLATDGCDVSGSIIDTILLALDIVDVWV